MDALLSRMAVRHLGITAKGPTMTDVNTRIENEIKSDDVVSCS